jgi:methionine sulfoxide reductase heme-binding subunit
LRNSRTKLIKIIVHACAWAPLVWLIWAALTNNLTINPIQAATQWTGRFALILLLASLACTPANTIFGFRQAIKLRRAIGLYAFLYAAIHLSIFIGLDYGFDWNQIIETIFEKRFTFVGAVAILILFALAITSFDWWKKRLAKNWKRLHRLVYIAALLVILHFAWARKGDIFRFSGDIYAPLLAGLILMLLLILRIPAVRHASTNLHYRLRARSLVHRQSSSNR